MAAGLRPAVDLSRCILYRTLEKMCEAHTPVAIKSWVDDLNTRITAPPKFAVDQLTKVATILRGDDKELDLIISPKSNTLSSSVLAGVALEANLKQLGLAVPYKDRVVDLGFDRGNIRYGQAKHKKRAEKARFRFRKIGSLARGTLAHRRIGLRLAVTAAMPGAGLWGASHARAPANAR
eukprot:4198192-Pyramimonas_sp.AAC.1